MSRLSNSNRYAGVALVAVLWLVAALTILVGGLLKTMRMETRTATHQRNLAGLHADADAVLLLAVHDLIRSGPFTDPSKIPALLELTWKSQARTVSVMPLNGLIDVNRAPQALIAETLRTLGGLDMENAQALAQAIEAFRRPPSGAATAQPFLASEDLLRIPGFSYELYAKIFGSITTELPDGSGRVNPRFSPQPVLAVLQGGGGRTRIDDLPKNSRGRPTGLVDTSVLRPDWIDTQLSQCIRLSTLLDGSTSRWRWQDMCLSRDVTSGLPWRHIGTGDSEETR